MWGGRTSNITEDPVDTGGRYDPAADRWVPTSTVGAPSPRAYNTAVWTGQGSGGCWATTDTARRARGQRPLQSGQQSTVGRRSGCRTRRRRAGTTAPCGQATRCCHGAATAETGACGAIAAGPRPMGTTIRSGGGPGTGAGPVRGSVNRLRRCWPGAEPWSVPASPSDPDYEPAGPDRQRLLPPRTLIPFVVLAAVGLLACVGDDRDGGSVADGSAGDGPSGAANNACAIPCLASLRKDCVPGGASPTSSQRQRESLLRERLPQAVSVSIPNMTSTSTSTLHLNGETCWSIVTVSDLSGSSTSVIKDGQGKTIATSLFGPSGYLSAPTGRATTRLARTASRASLASARPGSDCQPGTCR